MAKQKQQTSDEIVADVHKQLAGATIQAAVDEALRPKKQLWALDRVETRAVAEKLNSLSASGAVVFAVYPSSAVGGAYEIVSYKKV